jgi:hypothetical protein
VQWRGGEDAYAVVEGMRAQAACVKARPDGGAGKRVY